MKILVVDDEATQRRILLSHLNGIVPDSTIQEAENGQDALCAWITEDIDIIFLDLLMPVMDGMRLLDVLEKGYRNGKLPKKPNIIVVTGVKDYSQLRELTKRVVVESVMSKPVTRDKLKTIQLILNSID